MRIGAIWPHDVEFWVLNVTITSALGKFYNKTVFSRYNIKSKVTKNE